MSLTVIGIQGASVDFSPVKELEEKDTDWHNRRPISAHWINLKDIVDIMGGRPAYPKPQRALTGLKAKDAKRGITLAE